MITQIETEKNKYILNEFNYVKSISIHCFGKISIHLTCLEGNEEALFNSLAKDVHEEYNVVQSFCQVFIQAKNTNNDKKRNGDFL